jgi:hypothetical protein
MKQLSENNEQMKEFITKNLDKQVTKVRTLLMKFIWQFGVFLFWVGDDFV